MMTTKTIKNKPPHSMKLYPKKLRTLEDLEKEKKLLLKEKRKLDEEEIFSLKGIVSKGDDDDDEGGSGFDISSLLGMLPIKNPLISMGVQMAGRIFTRKKKKAQNQEKDERTSSKKKPSRIRAIAIDVITGYLKWKAIELTYKATRSYLKKRRQHNRERAAAGLDDD